MFVFDDGDVEALDAGAGLFSDATLEKLTEARVQTQDIFSTSIGGLNHLERWTVDYSAAWSYADTEESDSFGAAWIQEGLDLGYDLGDPRRPRLFAPDAAAFADAGAYALDEIALEPYTTEEDETALTLNLQRDFDLGDNFAFVKFGGKARLRGKEADFDSTIFDGFGADYSLADFDLTGVDYPFGPFLPIADPRGLSDFIRNNRGAFEIDQEDTDIERQGGDYVIDEDILAAYAMVNVDFGQVRLTGGVRVEQTDFDAAGTRVLIDEEDEAYANEIKVYGLDGRWQGRVFGRDVFKAQAEGIALWQCPDGSGYWLTTEQGPGQTVFHLFDRASLDHVGAFTGAAVANTDGIWLQQAGTRNFPDGAFYAVHDDQGVVGFDWRAIAAALDLPRRCPGG